MDQAASRSQTESIARELLEGYEKGQTISSLPSSHPGFDLDQAYEVEAILKRWREEAGHKSVGLKVGYASKAMWRALKLETLVCAHVYEDTVHYSQGNSADITIDHPRSLKVEPEIVFGLKQAITAELDGPWSACLL